MRNFRSVLRQSPAIALSAAALLFAAGTGAGVAATSAPSGPAATVARDAAATTLNWHRLPLGRGWHGSLKYAVNDGVVYLAGNAGKNGQTSVMARLPVGARPTSSQQDIPVATSSAVVGVIQLLNDGTIFPFDTTHDYTFVSLSGVSFGLGS